MADAPSRRASILSTIMRIESGGRNVPQNIDDINMRRGTPAQGYFQIINPTWSEFGGDKTGSRSAIDAPYATQLQVAQNIPVARWGPNTQAALRAAGYEPQPGETLGQMLTRYGEDPTATKPEDGGSTVSAAAPAAPTLPAGLLGASTPAPATPIDGAKRDKEKEEEAAYASLTREGMKLMAAEEPPAPPAVQPASAGGLLQATAPVPLPDFTQPAPSLPDFLEMLSQQRLRRA